MHLCRGNRESQWHREGTYDAIAEAGAAAGFTTTASCSSTTPSALEASSRCASCATTPIVVLGLLTTKTGALEDPDLLKRRIEEASRHVPLERLALSPQCGFASGIAGNLISRGRAVAQARARARGRARRLGLSMRVLVIGGGIGGMATAIALEQAGLDPVIYEQSPELTEIGAGIGMHANAMRVLARFGAADFVREHGVRVNAGEWRHLDDGTTIATQEYAGLAERYGDHYICMHRADLLESLVRAVPSHRINLGSRLIGVAAARGRRARAVRERGRGARRRARRRGRAALDGSDAALRRGAHALHRLRGVARGDPDRGHAGGVRAPDRDVAGARPSRHDLPDPPGHADLQRLRADDRDPARGVGPLGGSRRPAALLRRRVPRGA